jgi:hypothetical protein
MSKTIGNIKSIISSRLHGTTLNKIGDFYLLCKEAGETVANRIDLQEARRRALLPNAVYDQVYDYALPSDFKAPISLNKQANNIYNGDQSRTYSNQFNNNKKDNSYAVVWEDMTQFLRFAKYLNTPLVIDKADSLTENGTWAISGNGSNLVLDTNNYMSGIGSLKCTTLSTGPVTSVTMNLGNDNSNYYSKTITSGHFQAFETGWNLCRFDLSDAILTGTVNMASINYISITVTHTAPVPLTITFEKTLTTPVDMSVDNYKSDGAVFAYLDFSTVLSLSTLRLDNITAHIGTLYDINYYSSFVFRNTSGTWIEEPTSDSDLVNLSPLSYRIFDAELSKIITQQTQGSMGNFDYNYWNLMLEGNDNQEGLYDQYSRQFPSEREEGATTYYNFSSTDEVYDEDERGWGTNNQ